MSPSLAILGVRAADVGNLLEVSAEETFSPLADATDEGAIPEVEDKIGWTFAWYFSKLLPQPLANLLVRVNPVDVGGGGPLEHMHSYVSRGRFQVEWYTASSHRS